MNALYLIIAIDNKMLYFVDIYDNLDEALFNAGKLSLNNRKYKYYVFRYITIEC